MPSDAKAYYSKKGLCESVSPFFYLRQELLGEIMKRILGEVSDSIVEQWELEDHRGKKIVLYPEAKEHSKEKHINQYPTEEDYYYTMDSLEEIINSPDYVFYDKGKSGLEYYKMLRCNVLIAVRISDGSQLRVKSIYPVEQEKIENRKKKEEKQKLYNKYVVGVE